MRKQAILCLNVLNLHIYNNQLYDNIEHLLARKSKATHIWDTTLKYDCYLIMPRLNIELASSILEVYSTIHENVLHKT